jgi:hypothetical protein
MKNSRTIVPAALALTLGTGMLYAPVQAQQGGMQAGMQGGQPGMALFEERAPQIGEQLPDLTIVDDAGNPVNVRDIPGENYTVLVLGCLT